MSKDKTEINFQEKLKALSKEIDDKSNPDKRQDFILLDDHVFSNLIRIKKQLENKNIYGGKNKAIGMALLLLNDLLEKADE